jgi:hypothetical protein
MKSWNLPELLIEEVADLNFVIGKALQATQLAVEATNNATGEGDDLGQLVAGRVPIARGTPSQAEGGLLDAFAANETVLADQSQQECFDSGGRPTE